MRGKLVHELKLLVRVRVWGWVRVWLKSGHLLLSGLLNQYSPSRAARLACVPPERAQREPQGYAGLTTFRGWVRVRVLGYGSGVRGRKVKSRDCALASDLARATPGFVVKTKRSEGNVEMSRAAR